MKIIKFSEYIETRKSYCSLKTNFHNAYMQTEQGKREKKFKENLSEFIGIIVMIGVGYYIVSTDNIIANAIKEAFPK